MRKSANYILVLLAVAVISIAASVTSSVTINKPATPKAMFSVLVDQNDAPGIILKKSSEGWIYKDAFRSGGESVGYVIIVMEKY